MDNSPALSFAIQNKVFGLRGELVRWTQLKSYASNSAVTHYLRKWILPLGQNDKYRIEVIARFRNGERSKHYFSLERWFESRQIPIPQMRELDE